MSENTIAAYQINSWFKDAQQKISLVRSGRRDLDSMIKLHVSEGSYLGEIVGTYSKIALCDGYFRLLCGAGDDSMVEINALNKNGMPELFPGALIIAYDINGNIFALNSGACRDAAMGSVLYLTKESFAWEDLDLRYAQFLKWMSGLTSRDLIDNGWRPETGDKPIGDILEYLMGKAAAYNMFLKQVG
ncbi:MAG: DUF2625 domain-containing protein [Acetatifactor sp.]|nr:DUF2625 domain-containing protein [Acetatifactor sp.]